MKCCELNAIVFILKRAKVTASVFTFGRCWL